MSNANLPKEPAQTVSRLLQPHPLTSVMQMAITFCSACIAVAAIVFAVHTMAEERNARLVEIGVGVLRADPTKEGHISAARDWAMDLIDRNAGGLKFSKEARLELGGRKLDFQDTGWYDTGYGYKPSPPALPK